jgi:hypothetical protein
MNILGGVYRRSLEKVIGRADIPVLFKLAGLRDLVEGYPSENLVQSFPVLAIAATSQAALKRYGAQGGRGILLRSGYYAYTLLNEIFPPLNQAIRFANTVEEPIIKSTIQLNAIARTLDRLTGGSSQVERQGDRLLYHLPACFCCQGHRSLIPCCYWLQGLVANGIGFTWVYSGHPLTTIVETTCRATGSDICTFAIYTSLLETIKRPAAI